ncbi:MAG: glycosyltransferase family 9 protein [Planctomycetes bacterium]|nr:glycosyltransferase family 9 protein [Planctomycetota bacterium]
MTARFLVARLSALGDIVFAVPAVAALRERFPNAQIDWLVEDRFEELVRSLPLVDTVHVFPRKQWKNAGIGKPNGFASGLRAMLHHIGSLRRLPPYDAVIDFQGNLKSSLQLGQLDTALRVGFDKGGAKEGAHRRYDLRVTNPGRVHRSMRDYALVRAFLKQRFPEEEIASTPPAIPPWPLDAQAVRDTLAAIEKDVPNFVLLHHGYTAYGQDKEWPIEHWGTLCQQLRAAGYRPRLLWTPAERTRAEKVLVAAKGKATLAPATPSLDHLMALLDRAQLLIGTDSGPLHLSALRGNEVLALYGPTDPIRFAPPGPRAHTLRAQEDEAEPPPRDRSRRSPLMDTLLPQRVASEAIRLLS